MARCVTLEGASPPMLPWKLGGGNANLYLYLWRVSDKLLADEGKFYSVLLCSRVTRPLLFVRRSSQAGAMGTRTACVRWLTANNTGELHEKGRREKHWWQ